jgi:hypothetical protein
MAWREDPFKQCASWFEPNAPARFVTVPIAKPQHRDADHECSGREND